MRGLSPGRFRESFYDHEVPVVLRGHARDWPAVEKWDAEYLAEHAHGQVSVACSASSAIQTGSAHFVSMGATDAVRLVLGEPGHAAGAGYYYIKNHSLLRGAFASVFADLRRCTLVPDEVVQLTPHDLEQPRPASSTSPSLWIGQPHVSTPLHYDPWPNVIVQIRGTKTVTLASPRSSSHLYPRDPRRGSYWYSELGDLRGVSWSEFPKARGVAFFETTLEPGDVLFVPAGWWHQVENRVPAISVNYFCPAPSMLRRWTNPNTAHYAIGQWFEVAHYIRFLRSGGIDEQAVANYQARINGRNLAHQRQWFDDKKRNGTILDKWLLSKYPDFESTPFYQTRYRDGIPPA